MRVRLHPGIPVALASALVVSASRDGAPQSPPRVNPQAQILVAFSERLSEYVKLHERLEADMPRLETTEDPEKIVGYQIALARKIRAARRNAGQGDLFRSDVRALIRRLIRNELTPERAAAVRAAIEDQNPGRIRLVVNAPYPEISPLAIVPPRLLQALPPLPDHVEYRFVGRDLILRDTHANLIVDFMEKALP